MAQEVRGFTLTIPPGTQVSAPVTLNLVMPARIVDRIRCRIPPGPGGLVGFRLAASGVPIIPWNAGQWIIGDNEVVDFPLTDQITSGAWQAQGYNTGVYTHNIFLTFYLRLPQLAAQGNVLTPPLDLGA